METVKKEVKKLKEETKKCSLTLAAHIDHNVLGGDQAQEEVHNLFDYAKENDKEEENMSDDPVENTEEEVEGNNLLEDTFSYPSNGFDCDKCDFVAKTDAE